VERLLPWSLGVVAIDISLCDNEGSEEVRGGGAGQQRTRAGDKKASCSELRDLQPQGGWEFPGMWVVSYDSRECKRPAPPFFPHPRDNACAFERYPETLCLIGNGLFPPAI